MDAALSERLTTLEQDEQISAAVRRERGALLAFIRKRVQDAAEAEDVLQDALYELVAAHRLMQPVEKAGAWLMRVARNRIIDRFRKKKPEALAQLRGAPGDEDDGESLEDLLPDVAAGPDAALIREMLLEQVEKALDELPREQREVFIAHELEGASYKELAARWGVSVNTLLSRKRYAIRHLRQQLQVAYDEWLEE